jgi:hypothetical protein
MKTNEERLNEWYRKLHGEWAASWIDIPEKDFEKLLARPRREIKRKPKRPQ